MAGRAPPEILRLDAATAPGPGAMTDAGGAMFKTVVLGLDGSESSDRALEYATGLARDHGSNVRVVHVIEVMSGRGGGLAHLDERELQAKVEQQVKSLTDAGLNAGIELHNAKVGGPANVIAEVAARDGADVIVIGTRGHSTVAGVLTGSVAHRLLHAAHCPLMIIPPLTRTNAATDLAPNLAPVLA
jgi:nucleotide-binding universal stress UspA family protein